MLARYTPVEAQVLEDHYIACAKRIGIWGQGKLPLSANERMRSKEAGTAAGIERQKRSEEKKMAVLQAVRDGYKTSTEVKHRLRLSDTTVRKFLVELRDRGLIVIEQVCSMGVRKWRPRHHN